MRYEQYYRRILKLKKIRDTIYFYRFIILASVAIMVAISSTLFSIKGLVNGEVFFSNQVYYGETYTPQGQAIFGSVIYEYASADSDIWEETPPVLVGNYQVRGKSANNFNDYYYGSTHFFSIVPKPVQVNFDQDTILYGETPRISLPLAYQDTLVSFNIEYKDFSKSSTIIETNLDDIVITNTQGLDVTFCYHITQVPVTLNFIPRPINVKLEGGQKLYDGTPLMNESYQVEGSLAFEDTLQIADAPSQTTIGETPNTRAIKILNVDGDDVTHLYRINLTTETLLVTKRPLIVRSNSISKGYDGLPFLDDEFSYEIVSGTLLPDHQVEVLYSKKGLFQAMEVFNEISISVLDEGQSTVNEYYDISYVFGTLTIETRPLSVRSASADKTFDGLPLSAPEYEIIAGELATGDTIEGVCDQTILTTGFIPNTCEFSILHPSGIDVTSSYLLNPIIGSLMIAARTVSLQILPKTAIYNGESLEGDDILFDEAQLVDGHEFILDDWTRVFNVGTYNNVIQWRILDEEGIPVSQQYQMNISGDENALTIQKRPLTLTTKTLTQTYNGTPLTVMTSTDNSDKFDVIDGDLALGDRITVASATSLTNVGQVNNMVEVVIRNGNNQVVTSNYDLNINPGTLTVEPYQYISITTNNQEKIYDDQPLITSSANAYTISPSLFPGDYISNIRISSDQIEVGSGPIQVDPDSIVIRNSRNEIINQNYELIIVANQGQLQVNPRPYEIRINSQTKIYDDTPLLSNQSYSVLRGTLVNGHQLQITSGSTPPVQLRNPGGPVATSTIAKIFRGEKDVTSNYQFYLEEGTLTVNRRPITIVSNGGSKTYDGTALNFTATAGIKSTSLPLVTGHVLVTTFLEGGRRPINVSDSYTNHFVSRIIDTNNLNEDVSDRYIINYEPGEVTILRRNITLSIIPMRLEYNGTYQGYDYPKSTISPRALFDFNPVYLTSGTLPTGFSLETGLRVMRLDQGVYTDYEFTGLTIYNTNLEPVSLNNFNINRTGALTIERRRITIQSLSGTKYYDGTSFPKTKWISQGSLAPGDQIIYGETPDMIESSPIEYSNEIIILDIIDQNNRSVFFNYAINYQPGRVGII
jgi:hypothetical protein